MNAPSRLKPMLMLVLGASLLVLHQAAYAADAGGGGVKPAMVCMDCGTTAPPPAQPVTITRYVITDRLGNPVAKTNSVGAVIWRQTYTPYGETTQQPDPDGPGFTGHRHDAATGLVYMQARYYDPKVGRFLSVDPVSFSPQKPAYFNRYWYAKANPYKYTDPDGRCVDGFGCGAMAQSFGVHPQAAKPFVAYAAAAAVMLAIPGGGEALVGAILETGPEAIEAEAGAAAVEEGETSGTITRYMGQGEAESAARTGEIPNVGKDGIPRPTHVTTDPPVSSAGKAQTKYELPTTPTHRATVPANRVSDLGPTPDGRSITSGGGSQSATNQPIPVKPNEIKPLNH